MVEALRELDEQLQDEVARKERRDFEERLEQRMQRQNDSLVGDILRSMLPLGARYAPQHPDAQVRVDEDHQGLSAVAVATGPGQGASAAAAAAAPVKAALAAPAATAAAAPFKEASGAGKGARNADRTRGSAARAARAEPEEGKSIWDKLMDDDDDLLNLSDDEADKKREDEAAKKKVAEEEEQKKRAFRVALYGTGKPMYRWRKEGVLDPPAEQVLKGKSLFRAVASAVVALRRMENDALGKKRALLAEDEREMDKAVVWFREKTKAWLAQVLTTPLADVITKPDLVLDPRSAKIARGMGALRWIAKARAAKTRGGEAAGKGGADDLDAMALRLKVRIRGVLELLWRALEDDKPAIPSNILAFLCRMMSDGCCFPDGYLFDHEAAALDFSSLGHTRWMLPPRPGFADGQPDGDGQPGPGGFDLSRVKMVLGNFLVTRCLVPVLAKPWEAGVGAKPDKRVQSNLLMLATLVYTIVHPKLGGPGAGDADDTDDAEKAQRRPHKAAGLLKRPRKRRNKVGPDDGDAGQPDPDGNGKDEDAVVPDDDGPVDASNAEARQARHLSVHDVVAPLLPKSHYAALEGKVGFLEELGPLFDSCIIRVMLRAFDTSDEMPSGLRAQLQQELAVLIAEMNATGGEGRKVLAKRNEEMQQRLQQAKLRKEQLQQLEPPQQGEAEEEGGQNNDDDDDNDDDNDDDDDEDENEDDDDDDDDEGSEGDEGDEGDDDDDDDDDDDEDDEIEDEDEYDEEEEESPREGEEQNSVLDDGDEDREEDREDEDEEEEEGGGGDDIADPDQDQDGIEEHEHGEEGEQVQDGEQAVKESDGEQAEEESDGEQAEEESDESAKA